MMDDIFSKKHIGLLIVVVLGILVIALTGYGKYTNQKYGEISENGQTVPISSRWPFSALTSNDKEMVTIELVDAGTGEVVANTKVVFYSDNGVRCVMAPCPTDTKRIETKSDAIGRVKIEKTAFNVTNSLVAEGYEGKILDLSTTALELQSKVPERLGSFIFQGVVSEVDNGCWSDGICRIRVGEVWIITGQGWYRGPAGQVIGEPKVGDNIEFSGTKNTNGVYTILGDTSYYLKVL